MNHVQVRAEAVTDIREAVERYEGQRPGLGIEFLLELDAAIERATIDPEAYAVQYNDARRVLLRRFPYSADYLVEASVIQIFGVLHQHRMPLSWQSRLS